MRKKKKVWQHQKLKSERYQQGITITKRDKEEESKANCTVV